MAAAVSDYAPRREFKNKIKRTRKSLTIRLEPTVDILEWAGGHKQAGQIIVGFALEDSELQKRAAKKLKEKELDMVIANSCAAIGADRATVYIKAARSGWTEITDAAKSTIAKKIIAEIEKLI
jgi:phosphopantothenoylcysteine decarboxylase/phosphopantothenate--cysteine ligase